MKNQKLCNVEKVTTKPDVSLKIADRKHIQKKRFSLEGIIENGQVDEKALNETTKIWESRELQ